MECPFCGGQMQRGTLLLDGREIKPRWRPEGTQASRFDKLFLLDSKEILNLPDRKLFSTRYEIESDYCPACQKFIFSGKLPKY